MLINGKSLGLALSGGGFRATLFGLGTLWRLNEAGLLGQLDRVTSVSGGSIVAGVLGHRWHRLEFAAGRASNFEAEIADPVRAFCNRTIDIAAAAKGALNPFKTAGEYLADSYDKHLFKGATIRQLPDAKAGKGPMFIIYATNLQTGRSFRFRQDMLADWMLGMSRATEVELALAVAASSAFPPLFSPVRIETDPASWTDGEALINIDGLRREIALTDGGVYDNMGLESLVGKVDLVLVSDAGAPFEIEVDPADSLWQMGRVRDILIDQTRALRKRWLIDEFDAGRHHGAYWGIGTPITNYNDPVTPYRDSEATAGLVHVATRLAPFDTQTHGRLINWGYALADVALRQRAGLAIDAPARLPVPSAPLA